MNHCRLTFRHLRQSQDSSRSRLSFSWNEEEGNSTRSMINQFKFGYEHGTSNVINYWSASTESRREWNLIKTFVLANTAHSERFPMNFDQKHRFRRSLKEIFWNLSSFLTTLKFHSWNFFFHLRIQKKIFGSIKTHALHRTVEFLHLFRMSVICWRWDLVNYSMVAMENEIFMNFLWDSLERVK